MKLGYLGLTRSITFVELSFEWTPMNILDLVHQLCIIWYQEHLFEGLVIIDSIDEVYH